MNDFNLGNKIRELRIKSGLLQAEFAEKIGVRQSNLSGYERDVIPPIDKLIKIADVTDISLDELCGRNRSPRSLADVLQVFFYLFETNSIDMSISDIQFSIFDPKKDCQIDPSSYPVQANGDLPLPSAIDWTLKYKNSPLGMYLLLFFMQISRLQEAGPDATYFEWKNAFLEFAKDVEVPKNELDSSKAISTIDKMREYSKQLKNKRFEE